MNLFLFMFIGTHFVNDHDRNVVIGRLGCFKLSIYNTNYFFGFFDGFFYVLLCTMGYAGERYNMPFVGFI